ncbi:MAG: 50S ribosome-binding GTPase [Planctomycetes bacterium]|nr:50S ribosome-binding GTPase [Planctomycetota bacterium]
MPPDNQPLLRTLAPALRELERRLRAWLDAKHRYPITTLQRASLEGLAGDLERQADALQMEKPLLTIILMGGTGVGKSTLLNALAGGAIANASFARPTTRDPVVYYHHSIQTTRLDPALQFCKLASHDRPALEQKILVDTPDLDSNDLANREKLMRILPVADIVLYVGSQEKYHDKLGWELFLEQRQRRAFAFVLNKWDRCLHPGAVGVRPDDDLLRDLKAEGFQNPLLFRTCAQHWVDHPASPVMSEANGGVSPPVEGEQFTELVHWLEQGLTRLEVEAIKARGVSQLLRQLEETMEAICPPDLSEPAERIRSAWTRMLGDEAEGAASVLLNTLDPYQKEIEHHFATERQKHFTGLMAWYLHAFNRLRYTGSTLRDQIPFAGRSSAVRTPQEWDLARFTEACSAAASEQHLQSRLKALTNRLLVEADTLGIPLGLLSEPAESVSHLDWRQRYAQAMIEVIATVEQGWSQPKGVKRWFQKGVILLADWLPGVAGAAMGTLLLWQYTMGSPPRSFLFMDLLQPLAAMLITLVIMHIVVALCLPLRWQAIRGQFHERLEKRLREDLTQNYEQLLTDVTQEVLAERRQNEGFAREIEEVAKWLGEREQAASIVQLYGK